jgi:AcrR family transcriptional regulator
VSAPSRRDEYTEATRQALLQSAKTLFAEKGFAATSLAEVGAKARVTKGAVYHHFASKQGLFVAVLEMLDNEAVTEIGERAAGGGSSWDAAVAGLDAFLEQCVDPVYGKVCFVEGPSALGFLEWWQHGERHVAGLLKAVLVAMRDEGVIEAPDIDALTTVMYGALTAAALTLAQASDPRAVKAATRATVLRLIEGLRPNRGRTSRVR